MDGLYLGNNLEPLKLIGEGKPYQEITCLMNTNRFEYVELVAYSLKNTESRIISIHCLFQDNSPSFSRSIISYRNFDFLKRTGRLSDDLSLISSHGVGFSEFELDHFIELRCFYLQHIKA